MHSSSVTNTRTFCMVALYLLLSGLLLSSAGHARELLIATSSSIPPYVITDQHRGIVVEIIQQALEPSGYQVEFVYAPNRRVQRMIEERQVDGVYNLAANTLPNVHYSHRIIDYQNVAISLKKSQLTLNSLTDLTDLRVVVFQNSEKFLGTEFKNLIRDGHVFPEVSNQRSQVLMLFRERAEVIIMERRIFEYFHRQLSSTGEIGGDYVIHPIFNPAPRYAAFLDATVRDQFNAGLAQLEADGSLDEIMNRYLGSAPVSEP
ncbi:ABC transporter substrate-binding protein [Alcanivorax sp. 1008]|uniref:substrate-binding periplasmic protein n=1 Tax=Alcanivorax sp. 1008 TaxID=2816853 RepID=UPI001DBBB87D|nr:transporter substrate-binding domain-containing protein [Alcanivorax sp. 1008]MCC1497825.1 transporter substrate-binding domain-containing protein [Alcanivorax sp. 1008]